MQSIMEELYCGNIGFDSGSYGPDSPFVKAARRKLESLEALTATLDETQRALFQQYCQAQGEIEGIAKYDTYAGTLKFGILLMIELLWPNGPRL